MSVPKMTQVLVKVSQKIGSMVLVVKSELKQQRVKYQDSGL